MDINRTLNYIGSYKSFDDIFMDHVKVGDTCIITDGEFGYSEQYIYIGDEWQEVEDPIRFMEEMKEKIRIIESVLARNDNVYDRRTLQYCLNTLKRPSIRRKEENADDDTQTNQTE